MIDGDVSGKTEILAGHSVLRTSDLDEARHLIGQKFCDHRLQTEWRGTGLDVRYNHAAGVEMSVNYLHYGADAAIDPGMLEHFYLLQIPLSGRARIQHHGADVEANAQTATLLNPDRMTQMHWQGECRKLLVQISKSHLEESARNLIGAPPPGPIRFETKVDLTSRGGARLRQMALTCAKAIDEGALYDGSKPALDLKVETDLAHALLTLQRSNISHMIARYDNAATSRGIRLAVDFIHANMSESITLPDIARSAEMNVRTLQKGFRQRFGLTPMQYLKNARLDAAHYHLSARTGAGHDPGRVTQVAFTNGFSHLGRFSRDYKARFGYLPSHHQG